MEDEFEKWWREEWQDAHDDNNKAYRQMRIAAHYAYVAGCEAQRKRDCEIADRIGFKAHSRTDAQNACAEIAEAIERGGNEMPTMRQRVPAQEG